jgi:electron transfer flavoprotein alpha subunit
MMMFPKVDVEKCSACGKCIDICPMEVIVLKEGKAFVETQNCNNCKICMRACPENAFILA